MECFRVRPEIVHETVDGEVLIIHLGTGVYFTVRGCGVAVWDGVVAGASATRIASALPEGAEFLQRLSSEGLIEPVEGDSNGWTPSDAPDEPPSLHRFTDMEDLLLLDPVHEVDAEGWPHTPD